DQYNQLPELKKLHPWVKEVYSDTLGDVLDRLDKTYQNFFRGGGFPKFAKKGQYNSFTFKRHFTVKEAFIKFPKIGEVEYFNSRDIIGKPKTRSEEHTSELQSRENLVCRLLLEKKKKPIQLM